LQLGGRDRLLSLFRGRELEHLAHLVLREFIVRHCVVDRALLGLAGSERLEDDLADEGEEALLVGIKRLLRAVLSAVVNRDADRLRELRGELGGAELVKGEAAAEPESAVVADRLAAHLRAEGLERAREQARSAYLSVQEAPALLRRLVEESAHALLPMLALMHVRHDVVVLDHIYVFC